MVDSDATTLPFAGIRIATSCFDVAIISDRA